LLAIKHNDINTEKALVYDCRVYILRIIAYSLSFCMTSPLYRAKSEATAALKPLTDDLIQSKKYDTSLFPVTRVNGNRKWVVTFCINR
jgi:hypothetical protein